MMPVRLSVCPSVCLSVCDGSALAHYSLFRFQIPISLYRALAAVLLAGAVLLAVLLACESSRAMLASARFSCSITSVNWHSWENNVDAVLAKMEKVLCRFPESQPPATDANLF